MEGAPTATDVLICGAGAAGLTMAIDLARRGISFRLIERRDEPFSGSRGKGIQPRSLEVFEDLGIVDRVVALGGPYPFQREYRDDGTYSDSPLIEHVHPSPSEPYPLPVMVPQFLSERAMRERLAELGHQPEYGCELLGFEQDERGVSARVGRNGAEETVRSRYLIGADGGRSFVRHTLQIGFPGKTLGVRAVVADVVLTGLGRDVWHRFNEGDMDRQISFCPLAGTQLFQIQAPVPLEGDVDLSTSGLSAMVFARTGRQDIRIESISWASAFSMAARLADRYRVGRVFLIGDAAHVHPPTGGQGLNTSVQDAYNLSWKLASVLTGAPDTLLDSYEEERRPVAAGMLGLSTALLEAHKRGEMRRGRDVSQLDLAYPESSLALERPVRTSGLLAGDRAPDAPVRGSAGEQQRLFSLFKGPHWTLLGYRVDRDQVPTRRGLHIHTIGHLDELIDDAGHFAAAYALTPGDWVLVRPDGYVGPIVSSRDIDALETYCQRVGLGLESRPNG
ncbi:MAG TPA: FAD-dependent oxidoreductase [Vicinamibacterales bacterium]|nr:FAD-dependent oxidoreductase [Vicinamibacterales bacterium]